MILNQIILGCVVGVYYSLVAIGLVLVYKVSGIVNFAYGNMGMMGAYIALLFLGKGMSPLASMLLVIPVAASMGYVVNRFTMRPLKGISHSSMLIVTLGIMMVFEGIAVQIFGADYKAFPELVKGRPFVFHIAGGLVLLRRQDLLVITIFAIFSVFMALLLKSTKIGLAMRAVSQDEQTAKLMGVNSNLIISIAWMISASLSAVVAILASPKTYISPGMMIHYQIEGFTAAVLGGFESLIVAALGGMLLGILETFVGDQLGNAFKPTISLAFIVAVLLIKPEGLFGRRKLEKL
ncbi:MAG: branched-chain amino acid ABC transporter permease [Thermotogaceae bacterium]|nr:branched-chain amino acid ABC transporter permease [Thermotogaceae bacterium]